MESSPQHQAQLIAALRNPALFEAPCSEVRQIETHISFVLLTGSHAYKIKKAIRPGFLDFTTLAARRHYCEEELRLNRRLAPELYLDVVPITGSVEAPRIGGTAPILDYAVKMREFPQEALLGNVLTRDAVTPNQIDRLAAAVATFHGEIAAASKESALGLPDDVLRIAVDNFAEIRPLIASAEDRADLDRLETWTRREHAVRRDAFAARREEGFVRECHGDLHLGNIAVIDDTLTIFDCIEFNERMRWIDVMSEIAFTVMDLDYRGRRAYAQRFLNAYLEATGDYGGVAILRFYLVYRAMVRAKVAFLRDAQTTSGGGARIALQRDYHDHVRLASAYAMDARPAVIVTHGFAGCGKTTLTQSLLERIGAIRLRTDVERKRRHGLRADEKSRSGLDSDLYAPNETRKTYQHLLDAAQRVVASGFPAIIDGAFLRRWQRDLFRDFAATLEVPFIILDVCADELTLRARVRKREAGGADASEAGVAVLEHQLRTQEPIGPDERAGVVVYDGALPLAHASRDDAWRAIIDRLRPAAAAVV
jgi:uncharacterized protein